MVEDCVFAESFVLVPKVMDWAGEGGGESCDKIFGGWGGAIVGDENLHRGSCLITKTGQAQFQRSNMIVGADNQGHSVRGDHWDSS